MTGRRQGQISDNSVDRPRLSGSERIRHYPSPRSPLASQFIPSLPYEQTSSWRHRNLRIMLRLPSLGQKWAVCWEEFCFLSWENEGKHSPSCSHWDLSRIQEPKALSHRPPARHLPLAKVIMVLRYQMSSYCHTSHRRKREGEAVRDLFCNGGNAFPGASVSPSVQSFFSPPRSLPSLLGAGKQCLPTTQPHALTDSWGTTVMLITQQTLLCP